MKERKEAIAKLITKYHFHPPKSDTQTTTTQGRPWLVMVESPVLSLVPARDDASCFEFRSSVSQSISISQQMRRLGV